MGRDEEVWPLLRRCEKVNSDRGNRTSLPAKRYRKVPMAAASLLLAASLGGSWNSLIEALLVRSNAQFEKSGEARRLRNFRTGALPFRGLTPTVTQGENAEQRGRGSSGLGDPKR
jgi:hypothetical protein